MGENSEGIGLLVFGWVYLVGIRLILLKCRGNGVFRNKLGLFIVKNE